MSRFDESDSRYRARLGVSSPRMRLRAWEPAVGTVDEWLRFADDGIAQASVVFDEKAALRYRGRVRACGLWRNVAMAQALTQAQALVDRLVSDRWELT